MAALRLVTRTLFIFFVSTAAAVPAFRFFPGYIPAGGDVSTLPAGTSITTAETLCASAASCAGFTFDGPRFGPSPGTIYLKNATAADAFTPDPASNWTTYLPVVGPCDILLAAGNPCVAAYSMVRALYGAYAGPLYALNRSADGAVEAIRVAPNSGGVADAAAHDAFCAGTDCVVSAIFDQSPSGNDLGVAPQERGGYDLPVNASRFPIAIGGGFKACVFQRPKPLFCSARVTPSAPALAGTARSLSRKWAIGTLLGPAWLRETRRRPCTLLWMARTTLHLAALTSGTPGRCLGTTGTGAWRPSTGGTARSGLTAMGLDHGWARI